MGNGIRVKYNHVLQNPNRSRTKSYNKYGKTLEWYTELLAKKATDGNTKWIEKTMLKAELRLKKYGITKSMVEEFLKSKGKLHLLSN